MRNVTLQVRVPKDVAISVLGRLYGGGYITKAQYEAKVALIDEVYLENERKKAKKMDKLLARALSSKKITKS